MHKRNVKKIQNTRREYLHNMDPEWSTASEGRMNQEAQSLLCGFSLALLYGSGLWEEEAQTGDAMTTVPCYYIASLFQSADKWWFSLDSGKSEHKTKKAHNLTDETDTDIFFSQIPGGKPNGAWVPEI